MAIDDYTDKDRHEDIKVLHGMGYAQELSRSMSKFSNFAISFSIISILAGCFTTYGQAWNNGGPIAISWGWPIICGFILVVGLCMSEILSAYPTAGGIYYWALRLGAAGEQGKFWEMHDKLFENQKALDATSLEKYAGEIGLNMAKFKADMESHKYKAQIEAEAKAGNMTAASKAAPANSERFIVSSPNYCFVLLPLECLSFPAKKSAANLGSRRYWLEACLLAYKHWLSAQRQSRARSDRQMHAA